MKLLLANGYYIAQNETGENYIVNMGELNNDKACFMYNYMDAIEDFSKIKDEDFQRDFNALSEDTGMAITGFLSKRDFEKTGLIIDKKNNTIDFGVKETERYFNIKTNAFCVSVTDDLSANGIKIKNCAIGSNNNCALLNSAIIRHSFFCDKPFNKLDAKYKENNYFAGKLEGTLYSGELNLNGFSLQKDQFGEISEYYIEQYLGYAKYNGIISLKDLDGDIICITKDKIYF